MEALAEKIRSMKGWIKFLGIVSIIGGALYALTIVGILVAWLPIWIGVVLYQAGERADRYLATQDEAALVEFMGKLNTYFTIFGVVTLISIAFTVLVIAIAIAIGISIPHYNFHW